MRMLLMEMGYKTIIGLLILMVTTSGCNGSGDDSGDNTLTQVSVAPDASFTVSTGIGYYPLRVVFDASASSDSNGSIKSYEWSFGDGSIGSGSSTEHTYTSAGTYIAQLTVTDDEGLTDTATHEIIVQAPQTEPVTQTYTLSGTVTSAENVATDSDVNDSSADYSSNNYFDEAQDVSAPVTLSGYVNVAQAGDRGASFDEGDTDDYFLVSLTKGMNISLYMAEDPVSAQLELYLYDDQQNRKDFTMTDDYGVASLEAPEDGSYYVRVEADLSMRTATAYALTIGLTSSATSLRTPRVSDDFVPGEVIVRFEDQASKTVSTFADISSKVSSMGFQTKAGVKGRDRLLMRSRGIDKESFFESLGLKSALESSVGPGKGDSETEAKMETLWMIRALRKQSGVQYAEPNYIRKPLQAPNDPYYKYQWHYPLINLPDAWDITTGSSNVVVAVLDTGVLLDHPDLEGQLLDGYDFISDIEISLDGDGIDDDPDDPGDQEGYEGSSFHGTHVAGTIAALTNNTGTGEEGGVAGIAWNAVIMPLRALGKGGGTSYDIIQAVKYAAGIENDYGMKLSEPVDIINLSFGGEGYSQEEANVYEEVREKGVIVIAAAGNSGTTTKTYPASYVNVVSVSAATIDEALAAYSSYGDSIDIAAPGGSSTDENGDGYMDGVLSTIGDDSGGSIEMEYAFSMGTSMAASHVSGVTALMKSLYPGLTPDEFDTFLAKGYLTRDLGDPGRDDKFGYGLIDAYKAVIMAREGGNGELPAILSVMPVSINFGSSLTTAEVKVENIGGGSLALTGYYTDVSWLSVEASSDVGVDGLGTYTVEVTRDSLSYGSYTGTVTFEAGEDRTDVSVIMQVDSGTGISDGGYHYILLLDPDSYETIKQVTSSGANGVYEYSFSGLSSGDVYVIYAGTDPNNDNFICDECEACGAYISLDKPVELTVDGDMENIDFMTDINISLPTASTSRFAAEGLPLQRDVLKGITK